VLALAVAVGAAWAADVEGKIQQIDPADRMIVLEDGTRLWLAEGLQMEGLKEGATVKASYEERDGKKVVTQFQVAD
jgi:Cu/Ag efflux protein CusF